MEMLLPDQKAAPPPQSTRLRWMQPRLLWFALYLIAPTALIYVFLWLGSGLYVALLASATVSAISALVSYLRGAKQGFAPHMLALSLAGLGVGLVTGSERFLLAKESILTAMVGIWFMSSLWAERPLTYVLTRPMLEHRFHRKRRSWELLWENEPRFRHIWRISTIMWGIVTLSDAVLRVILAYTLPVYLVPAMQTGMMIATMLIMQVVTNVYYIVAGLWRILDEESEA